MINGPEVERLWMLARYAKQDRLKAFEAFKQAVLNEQNANAALNKAIGGTTGRFRRLHASTQK